MKNKNLKNIAAHTHQGKRDYQEDSYASGGDFILVSDGVGGLAKGEIASGIVSELWQKAIEEEKIRWDSLDNDVALLVDETIASLNAYAEKIPESESMGATLACAAFIDGRVVAIHVGDSRVYHFSREGHIKWRSKDHSLVQELVDNGVITEEEAATHPRRNIITRVLQAKVGLKMQASIHILENVAVDDILMVCSDGILESWTDEGLSSLMMGGFSMEETMDKIGEYSMVHSSDNNTAIMAQVASILPVSEVTIHDLSATKAGVVAVSEGVTPTNESLSSVTKDLVEDEPMTQSKKTRTTSLKHNYLKWVGLGLLLVGLLFIFRKSILSKGGNSTQIDKKEDVQSNRQEGDDFNNTKPDFPKTGSSNDKTNANTLPTGGEENNNKTIIIQRDDIKITEDNLPDGNDGEIKGEKGEKSKLKDLK